MKSLAALLTGLVSLSSAAPSQKVAVSVEGDQSVEPWSTIDQAVQGHYQFSKVIGRNEDTVLEQIKDIYGRLGPIDLLQFEMHGNPYFMKLVSHFGPLDDKEVLDSWDLDWFREVSKYLAADAPIILESCYTGYGENSLAAMIAYASGHPVYAPTQAVYVDTPTSSYEFANGTFNGVHLYGFRGDQGPFATVKQVSEKGPRLRRDNFSKLKVEVTRRFEPQRPGNITTLLKYTLKHVNFHGGTYTIDPGEVK